MKAIKEKLVSILEKYNTGELDRGLDDVGCGGLWDLSGEINGVLQGKDDAQLQREVIHALLQAFQEITPQSFDRW